MDKSGDIVRLAADSLAVYAVAQWPSFQFAPHHKAIISHLEAVSHGDIDRLMIFCPPRHGKSLAATCLFPAYYLGKFPDRFAMVGAHTEALACDFGRQVRRFATDDVQRAVFPDFRMSGEASAMHRFETTRGGAFYAVGVDVAVTGRGAHLLILDDVHTDRREAQSPTIGRMLWEWYSVTMATRLQKGGAVVLVQTRWCEDDLPGRILRHEPGRWTVLELPALAEEGDPLGRRPGEALWPSEYPVEWLEARRHEMGGAAFASVYQQKPHAAEGAVFRRSWWRFYEREPEEYQRTIVSLDSAYKTGAENDWSVATVWGVTATGFYLRHVWRERAEFPELKAAMRRLDEQFRPSAFLVEDRASGQSLIQELRAGTRIPVLPVKVDKDKKTRALACTPMIEAGKVWLPQNASWLNCLLDELSSFDQGRWDDQVDSMVMALNYLRSAGSNRLRVTDLFTGQPSDLSEYGLPGWTWR